MKHFVAIYESAIKHQLVRLVPQQQERRRANVCHERLSRFSKLNLFIENIPGLCYCLCPKGLVLEAVYNIKLVARVLLRQKTSCALVVLDLIKVINIGSDWNFTLQYPEALCTLFF